MDLDRGSDETKKEYIQRLRKWVDDHSRCDERNQIRIADIEAQLLEKHRDWVQLSERHGSAMDKHREYVESSKRAYEDLKARMDADPLDRVRQARKSALRDARMALEVRHGTLGAATSNIDSDALLEVAEWIMEGKRELIELKAEDDDDQWIPEDGPGEDVDHDDEPEGGRWPSTLEPGKEWTYSTRRFVGAKDGVKVYDAHTGWWYHKQAWGHIEVPAELDATPEQWIGHGWVRPGSQDR